MNIHMYLVYDVQASEYIEFPSLNEVENYVKDNGFNDENETELEPGQIGFYVYALCQEWEVVKTDEKKNYPCVKEPEEPALCWHCANKCEGVEEWPYSSEYDYTVEFKKKGESNENS